MREATARAAIVRALHRRRSVPRRHRPVPGAASVAWSTARPLGRRTARSSSTGRCSGTSRSPRVYRAYCRNLGAQRLRPGAASCSSRPRTEPTRQPSAAPSRCMRAAGITGWVLGHRFGNYVIDIAFPDAMLADRRSTAWAWHRATSTAYQRVRGAAHEAQQCPGPCTVGSAAIHLARPDQPAGLRRRGDPCRPRGGRIRSVDRRAVDTSDTPVSGARPDADHAREEVSRGGPRSSPSSPSAPPSRSPRAPGRSPGRCRRAGR